MTEHGSGNSEKRRVARIPVNIAIEFYLWNPLIWKKLYNGTIKNISEKGMYISARTIDFPLDSLLEIFMPLNGKGMIPVKASTIVWKRMRSDNTCESMGVEFSGPPEEYVVFVEKLRKS